MLKMFIEANKKRFLEKHHILIAVCIFAIVCFIYYLPYFTNLDKMGYFDWELHSFFAAVPRESILKYNQFPLWNPYYCGGFPLLAHPESVFLSPFYLLIVLFGAAWGIKLNIFIHTLLGMLGFYFLSRYLKMGKIASYLPSLVFFLYSATASHFVIGAPHWMTGVWIPWVMFFYLKSYKSVKYSFFSAFFLALISLEGASYHFLYTILFLILYSFFEFIKKRKIKILTVLMIVLLLTFLFSAVKIVPFLEFQKEYPRIWPSENGYDLQLLYHAFLDRNQWDTNKLPNQVWHWLEYSSYIGYLVLFLSLIGIIFNFKKRIALLIVTLAFLYLSFGMFLPFNEVIHKLPLLSSLRMPNRFSLMVVFGLAIFAGFGLTKIEKKSKIFSLFLITLVFFDLMLVNMPIIKDTFVREMQLPNELYKDTSFYQIHLASTSAYSLEYTAFLAHKGRTSCFSPYFGYDTNSPHPVEPKEYIILGYNMGIQNITKNLDYKGEVFLAQGNGKIKNYKFSPNAIEVWFDATREDRLVLNQNYMKGWHVNNLKTNADSYGGLISTQITPNMQKVRFFYLPTSFLVGLSITLITFLSILIFCLRKRNKQISSFIKKIFQKEI